MAIQINSAGRIVVGTDGSPAAETAVDYAGRVANKRGSRLLIVGIQPEYPLPRRTTALLTLDPEKFLADVTARTERRLAAAQERVRQTYPDVDVATQLVEGVASEVLVEASRDAELVILGSRGHSAPLKVRALGGTSDAVVTHAHGPVIVVPEGGARTTGPVVVGMDNTDETLTATRVAFVEAERLQEPLIAVHAYEGLFGTDSLGGAPIELTDLVESLEHTLDRMLEPLKTEHPEVRVERRVVVEHPVAALLEASTQARLLVVGSRGHGGFVGLLLGSTSRELLRHAKCPVMVVRH